MKIIVSHDVDHLTLSEHWRDRFYPGLIVKGLKGVLKGDLSASEFLKRSFSYRLERISELHEFNMQFGIKETFFFGMDNALSLSYNYKKAKPYITYLQEAGVEVGLHGINYNSQKNLTIEKKRLLELMGSDTAIGIRNHYLRRDETTLPIMEALGFTYDSTYNTLKQPWKVGSMWEIPISIMDATVLSPMGGKLASAKKESKRLLSEAQALNLPYFVINFHDIYFSPTYSEYKDWYTWLIKHLAEDGYEFISFNNALKELEK